MDTKEDNKLTDSLMSAELKQAIGSRSNLFWILAEHDHAHAPSDWLPEYKHHETISGFEDFMKKKRKNVVKKITKLAETCSEKELLTSVQQNGQISNLLYPCVLDYYT
jgi:hypothetical protein